MSTSPVDAARSAMKALWADQDRYCTRYPELQMRVWAAPEGMRVAAVIWLPGPKYGRKSLVIKEATWTPREVSETLVVEWGRRALASWLEEQLDDINRTE